MYDNFKVANYNNSLVSPELYARPLSRLFTGDVIDGFTVVPKTGLTVTLEPGNAFVRYGLTDVASARLVSLVAGFDLTHDTADASNPRIDSIVVYVDNNVALAANTPDGKGAAKAMIVKGTPNANPLAPNATAIQSAVGATNPYLVVAQDRIDAGVSVVASNKITDVRSTAYRPARVVMGTFSPTANGDLSVTGLGFKPSSVEFTVNDADSNGTNTGAVMAIGGMTPTFQYANTLTTRYTGTAATTSTARRFVTTAALISVGITTGPTLDYRFILSYKSMDADGFTVTVSLFSSSGSGLNVVYKAIG
jgi:hypothetical protein